MTSAHIRECTTGDCRGFPVGEAYIDDDPKTADWHPYCQDCIDDLFTADYTVRKLPPKDSPAQVWAERDRLREDMVQILAELMVGDHTTAMAIAQRASEGKR